MAETQDGTVQPLAEDHAVGIRVVGLGDRQQPKELAQGVEVEILADLHRGAEGQDLGAEGRDVEAVGLVKFDFLGLKTLTIIDWAVRIVNETYPDLDFDITRIPERDARTFELLRSTQTAAVFQLESSGMQELVRKMKPTCYDDITAINALFRPGPLGAGMDEVFVERKHGRKRIEYLQYGVQSMMTEARSWASSVS